MKEDQKVAKGFDRDVNYKTMKKRLTKRYEKIRQEIEDLPEDHKSYVSKRRIMIHKLIYIVISMIQLRNGSRISEACEAFREFIKDKNLEDKVIIKIAKSEKTKGNNITKARYRKMIFPEKWIKFDLIKDMKFYIEYIKDDRLRKRVLDYLLNHLNCNTHSLRYAFINYMLYDQKIEMALVAKMVGHSNCNQLVTYTQSKNCDKLFDLDI